jgi:hypothetical protein
MALCSAASVAGRTSPHPSRRCRLSLSRRSVRYVASIDGICRLKSFKSIVVAFAAEVYTDRGRTEDLTMPRFKGDPKPFDLSLLCPLYGYKIQPHELLQAGSSAGCPKCQGVFDPIAGKKPLSTS